MQLKELSKLFEWSMICNHLPLLKCWIISKINSLDILRKQSRKQRSRLKDLCQLIFLHQAIVIFQEGSTLCHPLPYKRNMIIMKANILQSLGKRVQVKLAFFGIVIILNEFGPFLNVRPLCFDKVRKVRRYHSYNILDVHFIN